MRLYCQCPAHDGAGFLRGPGVPMRTALPAGAWPMSAQSLPRRILSEAKLYSTTVRNFRRNARLYLFSIPLMAPGMAAFGVLYNLYLLELGYNEILVGQALSATALGTMAGGIPSGMLYSRFGGRASFFVGVASIILTRALLALVQTPPLILVFSFLSGIANATISTVWLPFMADETDDDERTYLFSMNDNAWTVSEMVGSLIGGFLPGLLVTWLALANLADGQRWTLLIVALSSAVSFVPILAMRGGLPPEPQAPAAPPVGADEPPPPPPRPGMSARRGFLGGAAIFICFGVSMGLGGFYNVYFSEFHRASTEQVGLYMATLNLVGVIAITLLPTLRRRFGIVQANVLMGLAGAPLVVLLGLPLSIALAFPIFLLSSSIHRGNWMLYLNLVMEVVPPRERGR
ncbi:MAG: MFS transporter, partial [Chloroflexi bacterium]|nr:MFS transporter [Chloroflexota bacterium]